MPCRRRPGGAFFLRGWAAVSLGFLLASAHVAPEGGRYGDPVDVTGHHSAGEVGARSDAREDTHALSVYPDDASLLAPFHESFRNFTFGGDTFVTIVQDWASGGVSAVVWDAAIVLCDYIAGHSQKFAGRSVLEIGAGTGMAGICAAKFGSLVTLTDRKQALSTLKTNVKLNLGTDASGGDSPVAPKVQELDWRDSATHALLAAHWDIVIGADVVYRGGDPAALLDVLSTVDADVVYLSCRLRYEEDGEVVRQLGKSFEVELELDDAAAGVQLYVLIPLSRVSARHNDL